MILDRIFQDKDDWQEDAFDRIKSDLLSVKDNRFVQYRQMTTTHLVCVYGKPQVGKTTLILNMIGLKDDICKKDVSDVLRGGIARGNSSTSTAIIYSQSDSDKYGVNIETLEGQNLTDKVEYFTSDQMRQKLQSIRDDVENNHFSNKGIVHIFIPKNFFSESSNKISILDLPGVGSRNVHEKAHVDSLMTRYIPISSVCIIICPSNVIQSLKIIDLPNGIDWKNLSHKFFVVVTKSYCAGNIKEKYFSKPRDQRGTSFLDFIQKKYKEELSEILGNDNKTNIFPLDMGDSLEKLCAEELQNEEDRKEVKETRDYFLLSLRDSILNSKGNNLLSCIKELRVIVNKIEENRISRLEGEKKEKDEELERLKIKIEKKRANCNEFRSENKNLVSNIDRLNEIDTKLKADLSRAITSFSANLLSIVKKKVEEKSLFKNKNGVRYFYDKNKICLKTICDYLSNQLDKTIVSKACLLMEEYDLNIDIYASGIASSIYSQFVNVYKNKLYPPSNIFNRLKSLFGNSLIELQHAYGYVQQIEIIVQSEIQSSVITECKNLIRKKRNDYLGKSKRCKASLKSEEKRIKSKEENLECIKVELETINKELEAVKYQKEKDEDTLKGYLKHATEAYLSQRDEILMKINSNETSPTDKFLYVVLQGIIDKDYKTLIKASNE